MKPIKCEIHEYAEDGITIKITYHDSIRKAKKYIKENNIKKYHIKRTENNIMITKKNIEELAMEIKNFLEKNLLADDVYIYYNNKRISSETKYDMKKDYPVYKWTLEENIDPHDYFEYAAYDHILSMSFEGNFYDLLNYNGGNKLEKFNKILNKYHTYYELGNAWNLTLYSDGNEAEFEYTKYNRPQEPINLYMRCVDDYDPVIANIMIAWYHMSEETGDKGSCVIGAGFNFNLNGNCYHMTECSPWQGSLSWEKHVPTIKKMLENIGATDVYFKYGILD